MLFAVQVQSDFRNQAVWSNGRPIQFRIGINLGEVTQGVENIQGHCVNVAARLQQFAEPRSIVISSAVRDAVRERSGMSLRSLGRPALKNIEDPIEVFSVSQIEVEPAAPP